MLGLVDRSRRIQGISWQKSPCLGFKKHKKLWNNYRGLLLSLKLQGSAGRGLETSHPAGADATMLQLLELRKGATTELFFNRGNIRRIRGPIKYPAAIAKALFVEVRG